MKWKIKERYEILYIYIWLFLHLMHYSKFSNGCTNGDGWTRSKGETGVGIYLAMNRYHKHDSLGFEDRVHYKGKYRRTPLQRSKSVWIPLIKRGANPALTHSRISEVRIRRSIVTTEYHPNKPQNFISLCVGEFFRDDCNPPTLQFLFFSLLDYNYLKKNHENDYDSSSK